MANKSSKPLLDTFQEILQDVEEANMVHGGETSVGSEIVSHISSTMTNQAATQKNVLIQCSPISNEIVYQELRRIGTTFQKISRWFALRSITFIVACIISSIWRKSQTILFKYEKATETLAKFLMK